MKKILAIDFGTVRVGLAINQELWAEPYQIIANDEQLFDKLKEIIAEEQIELILVGLSENVMAEQTKKFAAQLESEVDLPLKFTDETLSSAQVHHKLINSPMKKSRRQQPIDHYAAAEFLQEWLEINQDQLEIDLD